MAMRTVRGLLSFGLVGAMLAGCGGGNLASRLAQAPAFAPKDQTKCGVMKSQARPLIVEWPSADRQVLESKLRGGVVAVRYHGCEMEVLDRCSVPAKYGYLGTTRAQDRVVMKDADSLYSNLPVGAAKLEANLERSGQLTVEMSLVGRYEADKTSVRSDELTGECTGATHFIYGVSVGAFDFYAGADANAGAGASLGAVGAGGKSQSTRETLTKNGDPESCAKATPDDKNPPAGCGALIRIEVVPLGEPKAAPAQVSALPAASAPAPASASSIPEPSHDNAVHVSLVAPDDTTPWSLHAKDGELVCALPCTRWIAPASKYYLQRDTHLATTYSKPLQIQIPDDLPYPVGSTVAAAPDPGRGSSSIVWPIVTGVLSLGALGPGILMDVEQSGYGPNTGVAVPGIVLTAAGGAGLVASVWWLVWSHGDRLTTEPLNTGRTASTFTLHPTPTGIGGTF
jgi:hypothetical protein